MIPVFAGLLAVLLPALVLKNYGKRPMKRPYLYVLGSFAACLAALCQEVLAIRQRCASGDISGIMDTIGAVVIICVGLSVVVLLLNWMALALICSNEE